MSAQRVRLAVEKRISGLNTSKVVAKDREDRALREALEIIRIFVSDLPWYKKIIFSVKALIGGIEGYLEEEGLDV